MGTRELVCFHGKASFSVVTMLTMAFSYLLILAYKKFHKIFQEMEEEVKKTKLENEEKEDQRLLELEKEKQ